MRSERGPLWRRVGWLGAALLLLAAPLPGVGRDVLDAVHAQTLQLARANPADRPAPALRTVSAQYFGTHIHRLQGTPIGEPGVTAWPQVPMGHLRLWDSGVAWLDVNPRPGRWDFRRLDVYVQTAEENGAALLYTLGLTPAWASARPAERCPYGVGCSAEPRDLSLWTDYVRTVAQRYGSRIQAYELWNEPNFSDIARDRGQPGFYTGSVATLVEMAGVARQVLDEVNPAARLCTPGFVNGPDRLELFLAAGGRQHVQAVCYHFYASHVGRMAEELREVRAIMARQGVAHLPLWNTETGVELHRPGDPPSGLAGETVEEIAARIAQLMIYGASVGIERFYQYAWDSERSGMFHPDGQPRPALAALATLSEWLEGTQVERCRRLSLRGAALVSCVGQRGPERFVWLWMDDASRPTLARQQLPGMLGLQGLRGVREVVPLFGPAEDLEALETAWAAGQLPLGRTPLRLTLPDGAR